MRLPVAVPDKIFRLTLFLDFIDRCHSLRSLSPPQAALPSLPNSTTSAYEQRKDHFRCLYMVTCAFLQLRFCPVGDGIKAILCLMATDGQAGDYLCALAACGDIRLGVCQTAAFVGAKRRDALAG